MSTRALPIIFIIIMVLAGCVSVPITVNNLTDQTVNAQQGRKIFGSACGFQLLMLIPISINGRAERAFDTLREMADKNTVIADVKIRERWTYAFIGTVYCTDIQAMAYPIRTGAAGRVDHPTISSRPTDAGPPAQIPTERKQ